MEGEKRSVQRWWSQADDGDEQVIEGWQPLSLCPTQRRRIGGYAHEVDPVDVDNAIMLQDNEDETDRARPAAIVGALLAAGLCADLGLVVADYAREAYVSEPFQLESYRLFDSRGCTNIWLGDFVAGRRDTALNKWVGKGLAHRYAVVSHMASRSDCCLCREPTRVPDPRYPEGTYYREGPSVFFCAKHHELAFCQGLCAMCLAPLEPEGKCSHFPFAGDDDTTDEDKYSSSAETDDDVPMAGEA